MMYGSYLFTFMKTYGYARIVETWRYRPLFLTRRSGSGYSYSSIKNKDSNVNREKDDCTDLVFLSPSICVPSLPYTIPGFLDFEWYSYHVNSQLKTYPESLLVVGSSPNSSGPLYSDWVHMLIFWYYSKSWFAIPARPFSQDTVHITRLHTVAWGPYPGLSTLSPSSSL